MEVLPYTDYIFGNEDEMAAFADSQKIDSKVIIINYRIWKRLVQFWFNGVKKTLYETEPWL